MTVYYLVEVYMSGLIILKVAGQAWRMKKGQDACQPPPLTRRFSKFEIYGKLVNYHHWSSIFSTDSDHCSFFPPLVNAASRAAIFIFLPCNSSKKTGVMKCKLWSLNHYNTNNKHTCAKGCMTNLKIYYGESEDKFTFVYPHFLVDQHWVSANTALCIYFQSCWIGWVEWNSSRWVLGRCWMYLWIHWMNSSATTLEPRLWVGIKW